MNINALYEKDGGSASLEEENELIKRFLMTLEAEISANEIHPSNFSDFSENVLPELPQIFETFFQNVYVRENYINILSSIISISYIFKKFFIVFL